MLKNWTEFLSPEDIQEIHDTSMELLKNAGIQFPEENAINIFKEHGFKTEGQVVYMTEEQVMQAIKSVPRQFTVHARNPERNITIGDGSPIFAPGYGAPFLVDAETGKRTPTIEDYHNLAKLAHVLPNQDMSGHLMVEPQDIPSETAHMQMLLANILHSDKAFIGSSEGAVGAQHTMDMVEILFGGVPDKPVTFGLVNPLSPLGYGTDMVEAIIAYASARQPVIIATLVMAGSTGPITPAGVLALQNAEQLAGIVLTQLINAGTPALYGSTSTNIDMRTGSLAIGGPELSLYLSAHAQLARFYGLPSRGGGALTDSSILDAQAGYESMFSLLTTVNSGIDFVLHSAGILSSYLAFSYEKFVMDDELCGMMRRYRKGIEVNAETLAYQTIVNVGRDGHYLGEPETLKRCRTEFWQPSLSDRSGLEAFWMHDPQKTPIRAKKRWQDLLVEHKDPDLDKTIAQQLENYVEEQMQE